MTHREWRGAWERLVAESRRPVERDKLPFPTEAQLDLLRAALLPAEQAAPAWRRWKSRGLDLETVDGDSFRLLSQLWTNHEAAGVEAADLPILKGVYRQALATNAVVLASAVEATKVLRGASIPVLFIKGAALLTLTGQLGLRLIGDVDVLVPESEAERAVSVLCSSGYTSTASRRLPVHVVHAWPCRGPNGGHPLDVHWWAFKTAGDDSPMFGTAQTRVVLGQEVLIPSATETLLMTVANAFPGAGAPLRWIADAMALFEVSEDSIDWEVVLQRTLRTGLTLNVAAGLDFLAREFDAPVPRDVIEQLRRRRVHWRERAAHWSAVHNPGPGRVFFDQLERHQARRVYRPRNTPRDFPAYLAEIRSSRRSDVLRRVPRTAIRTTGLVLLRFGRLAAVRLRSGFAGSERTTYRVNHALPTERP